MNQDKFIILFQRDDKFISMAPNDKHTVNGQLIALKLLRINVVFTYPI